MGEIPRTSYAGTDQYKFVKEIQEVVIGKVGT